MLERPTVFVVHPKERRGKCSIEPLRGRPGFVFTRFPALASVEGQPLSPYQYIRLGVSDTPLTAADATCGLLLLDGTWRLAEKMAPAYAALPVRGLSGWETAYPRCSKLTEDPAAGLATIEALYAAYVILGRPTTGLLDHYRWGEEFLQRNAARLRSLS